MRWSPPAITTLATALLTFAIGLYAVIEGVSLGVGRLRSIESGAFPVAIGALLVLLSIILLVVPSPERDQGEQPVSGWAGPVFVGAAMLVFVILIDSLGLVGTISLVTAICAAADRSLKPRDVLILSASTGILCAVIFIYLLRLPLAPFWW